MLGREIAIFAAAAGSRAASFLKTISSCGMVGVGIDLESEMTAQTTWSSGRSVPIKDAALPLKNEEQLFDVAMLLTHDIDDHRFDLSRMSLSLLYHWACLSALRKINPNGAR